MTMVLFFAISTYGAMVLSGVVEEKSSRTVEVLLARMPARNLLAGKIAGIGLLGLGQIVATAIVALVAASLADSFDVPAVRGSVLAWAVVWFVLGYGLFATVFWHPRIARAPHRRRIQRHRPGHDHPRPRILGVVRRDRQRRHHLGATGLVVPDHRAARHAQPHRHGRHDLVGSWSPSSSPSRHRRLVVLGGGYTCGPSSTPERRSRSARRRGAPLPSHPMSPSRPRQRTKGGTSRDSAHDS